MNPRVKSTTVSYCDVCHPDHPQRPMGLCCRKYQVVFCYTIIERNNRHVLPVIRSSAGGDRVTTNTNPLDSFFPFDPYLLKRCTGWLFSGMKCLLTLDCPVTPLSPQQWLNEILLKWCGCILWSQELWVDSVEVVLHALMVSTFTLNPLKKNESS